MKFKIQQFVNFSQLCPFKVFQIKTKHSKLFSNVIRLMQKKSNKVNDAKQMEKYNQ